jgi:CBS domain-containing membrane protein
MLVREVMTAEPITIDKSASLFAALRLMTQHECHHLPVTGRDAHIIGILTDGDCYRAMGKTAPDTTWDSEAIALEMPVHRAMTPAPIVVETDTPLTHAVELMLRHHISCVLVMRSESLAGIVTTFDVMYAFLRRDSAPP